MRSRESETIAGFCRQCHSDVHLANRIYSCQCGSTSEESYDSPPSWVFKLGRAENRSSSIKRPRPRLRSSAELSSDFTEVSTP